MNANEERTTHFYTFWEGPAIPTYLQLCMETWYKAIPQLKVNIINYDNLSTYVGGYVNIAKLKRFSLAMQSDVISAIVLSKYGGTFIDVDTIITGSNAALFADGNTKRLKSFGVPDRGLFHVAVLSAARLHPVTLHWAAEASRRVEDPPKVIPWNYLAGSILEPLAQDPKTSVLFEIVDRKTSGNILESTFNQKYEKFYFDPHYLIDVNTILSKVTNGIISLHNSWTPKWYSEDNDRSNVLRKQCNLSMIFNELLG